MPAVPISGSPNITSLDDVIKVNLCTGYFLIDLSASTFTAEGIMTSGGVQGASIQITNPVGVIIDPYPTSGFDILPPMTSVYSFAIPLIAGVYQYGTYTIAVRLTDENGTTYTVTKSVNICPPDPNNQTRNYGCLNATMNGNCDSGELVVIVSAPPNYKGTQFTSQVNDLTLEYPTASGLDPLETTQARFGVQLYEGQYKLTGTVCVLYSYGDEVYYYINYKVKCEKIIRCIIDECCVQAKFEELRLKLKSDCTAAQKEATFSTLVEGMTLFNMAKLAAKCGSDPSDILGELEALLGCQCTCNCNEGVPIIGDYNGETFIYRALLTQTGTSIPTAVESDFNQVEISWAYSSAGLYIGTVTGLTTPLTAANTFVVMGSARNIVLSAASQLHTSGGFLTANQIFVTTNDAGVAANGLLNNTAIEISIL